MAALMLENQDTSFVCQKNMCKVPCFVLEFFTSFLQYSLARFLLNDLLDLSSLASIRVCFSAMKANVRFVYPSPPSLNRLFYVALSTQQVYRLSFCNIGSSTHFLFICNCILLKLAGWTTPAGWFLGCPEKLSIFSSSRRLWVSKQKGL